MNTHLPRRDFMLAAAGFALTMPTLATAAVRIRPRPLLADKITLGFIGLGIQNRGHLNSFLGDPAVHVLAVAEVDTTRREDALKRINDKYKNTDAKGYVDYKDLLARNDIDAVVIASPDHWHAIQAIDAVKAGKDVYCEKPLTLKIAEAKAMIDAVRKTSRILQTGSQQRTENDGRFRKACEFIRSGRIGQILSAHVAVGNSSHPCDLAEEPMESGLDWDRWLGPAPKRPYNSILSPRGVNNFFPNWRNYSEYSGGLMTDWGAHHFDIVQWALDMDHSGPVEVIPPHDPKSPVGAKVVYANGVEVTHGGPFMGGSPSIAFIGTKGLIMVNREKLISLPDEIIKEPLKDNEVHLATAPSHHANWLDCIKSRKLPICDVEVGARSITVAHLMNFAYWHRRPLKWDPANWNFGSDTEANGWMDYERRKGYELPTV